MAKNAKVFLRPATFGADTNLVSLLTDNNGYFAIDTVKPGVYVIDATSGDSIKAFNDSLIVRQDSVIRIKDTLRPFGSITGTIALSQGGDKRNFLIYARGLNSQALPDSSGKFAFDSLAKAKYDIEIMSLLPDYATLDTSLIQVSAGQATPLGTINMPFIGIPVPLNVKISYDLLKQIVTLTWNKPTAGKKVKGYTIYRSDSGTTFAAVNARLVTDTTWSDSTGVQDQTYGYEIAAVDTTGSESTKSTTVSVKVTSAFKFVMSFGSAGSGDGQFNEPGAMAADSSGNIYVLDPVNTQAKFHKYSSNGVFIKTWVAGSPLNESA